MTTNTSPTPRALPAALRDVSAPRLAMPDARGPAPRSDVFCTLACLGRPQGSVVSLAG